MIYAQRPRPWARQSEWRLEDGVLIGQGRRHTLTGLRAARIARGDGRYAPDALILHLAFRTGQVTLSSLSFQDRLSPFDQTPAMAAFARSLLEQAAIAAPTARYEIGRPLIPGVFFGAAAILGVGVVLVLLATVAAASYALGVELAARLAFVLFLLMAVWPWIGGLGVRRFDPAAIPSSVLP